MSLFHKNPALYEFRIKTQPNSERLIVTDVFFHHHHHQPINVPTAGTQAFLMDYPQGERAITHHAGPVRIGGC
jgi:hypothetical protein